MPSGNKRECLLSVFGLIYTNHVLKSHRIEGSRITFLHKKTVPRQRRCVLIRYCDPTITVLPPVNLVHNQIGHGFYIRGDKVCSTISSAKLLLTIRYATSRCIVTSFERLLTFDIRLNITIPSEECAFIKGSLSHIGGVYPVGSPNSSPRNSVEAPNLELTYTMFRQMREKNTTQKFCTQPIYALPSPEGELYRLPGSLALFIFCCVL